MNPAHRLLRIAARSVVGVAVAVGVILPASVALADPSPQDIERQLDRAHEELEDIVEDHNRISEEIKATDAAIAQLGAQLAPLVAQLDSAHASVAGLATIAYKSGGALHTAGVLLSANSTATLIHQVESMDRIALMRQREIDSYSRTRVRIEQEKKRLDGLRTEQGEKQRQLADRKARIEGDIKKLEDLERRAEDAARRAGQARPKPSAGPPPPPPGGSGRGAVAVRFAYAQLGKMYRWGAAGPGTYDCSGLTMAAWSAAGVGLPHNAAMQYRKIAKVSRSQLVPGDLVFYRNLGHVGIYIGNNQIIHASRTGQPVAVAGVDRQAPYGYGRPG